MAEQSVLTCLAEQLAQALQADERRVLLGEDVRDGGMLGLSRVAVADEQLADRIVATPLAPATTFVHAAGMAMAGLRPIVLLPSAAALIEGFAGLAEASRVDASTAGERQAPMVILAPCGPGFGLGGDNAATLEVALTALPGLRVISCGDASRVCATVAQALAADGPTVVLLARTALLCTAEVGGEPSEDLLVPQELHTGAQATVFSWGPALANTQQAVADARNAGFDVGLVDVVSLAPLAVDALVAAAATSGKLVIAHGGGRLQGLGAELAAVFADHAILHLDAPVTRVTGTPGPWPRTGEQAAVPSVEAIREAIDKVVNY